MVGNGFKAPGNSARKWCQPIHRTLAEEALHSLLSPGGIAGGSSLQPPFLKGLLHRGAEPQPCGLGGVTAGAQLNPRCLRGYQGFSQGSRWVWAVKALPAALVWGFLSHRSRAGRGSLQPEERRTGLQKLLKGFEFLISIRN